MIQPPENVAAAPADALKTESGIARIILKENPEGETIAANDWLLLHYTGWTTDGKMFDSTRESGQPAVFPIDQLIPGMSEALQLARVGESIRVWIPEELAYKGMAGMPQGTLVFEFEILKRVTPAMPDMKPSEGAVELRDGLAYKILSDKGGECIKLTDIVTLEFVGWAVETGQRFQSSIEVGEPLVAITQQLFPGLRDVLVHAHKGDILVAWIPQRYGIDPHGQDIKGDLVFSIEVEDVKPMPEPIAAPDDVAAAPADADKTASGLCSKVIKAGSGKVHPKAADTVRVHYTGWTTDGKMFDSSVQRGEPIEFGLNQVIPGWSEGVQLMVEGETRRLWIPEELAYRGMPGAPAGMLVFDVELLAIV